MSRQLPQLAPAPVRIVSSATVVQPAVAASRIWRSVTPLQMQTYTVENSGSGHGTARSYFTRNENDCQF